MELLPEKHEEFSQPEYWNRFFKRRGQIPFEWYGEYQQLHSIIHKYIVPANKVLVVGCGNSALSENMYDNGLQNLVNIDISDVVIRQMKDKHSQGRPKMTFDKMDVTQMTYPDGDFNAALDKGTLDALLISEEAGVVDKVKQMFEEVSRTLRLGGRYIIISLLQDHVQRVLLDHFTNLGWPIRIHKVSTDDTEAQSPSDDASSSSPLPVFAIVLTKLKAMQNMPQIVEVCRIEDQIDRLEDVKYLAQIIQDIQYYHTVRQNLKKRLPSEDQVTLHLHSKDSDTPRYTLTVVDSPTMRKDKFAIFIVPQGREHEWLFSTPKGRIHLLDNTAFQRLVVVALSRGHDYENLEAIKAELSRKVLELAPHDCPARAQIPFLSIGEDIGKRYPVAKGTSPLSGDYLVEDIELNGRQVFRRLIFLSRMTTVQSEMKMVEIRKKKKRGNRPMELSQNNLKVDKGYLSSDYASVIVGGLALLPSLDIPVEGVLVGLGGGSIPSFIQGAFSKVTLDCIELDPVVVDVAKNWFALEPDEHLRVHVGDGARFVQELASQGAKKDFLIIDADGKDATFGLEGPAPVFLEPEFVSAAYALLKEDGLLMVNVVGREEALKQEVVRGIQNIFGQCATLQLEEHINLVLFATKEPGDSWQPDRFKDTLAMMDAKVKAIWKDSCVDLVDTMEGMDFLS